MEFKKHKFEILIIKIAAIGDIIMALPLIDTVHNKYPGAKITWLCGRSFSPLIETLGTVEQIITINENKLLTGRLTEKIWSLMKVWKKLLFRHFDLIIIGHPHPYFRLLTLTARGKELRSFGYKNKRCWPIPGRHHCDEYVRLVTGVDGPEAIHGELSKLKIPLPANLKSQLIFNGSPLIVLAPGGARNLMRDDPLRRWPLEHYTALADILIKNNMQVIITGAYSDKWICEYFSSLDVIDFVGKTSILEALSLFGNCNMVITHDSSPLHLAGLAGTPLIALFGPTNPYEKVPKNANTKIIWGGEPLACRPCYDGKTYADCNNNVCMKNISVSSVYEEILKFLRKSELL